MGNNDFKVGDKVIRTESGQFRVTAEQASKVGTVIAIGGGTSELVPYRVSFDEDRYAYYYGADELELAPPAPVGTVEFALQFIEQLRQRGDQPGKDFADILQPLADKYHEMKYRLDGLDK